MYNSMYIVPSAAGKERVAGKKCFLTVEEACAFARVSRWTLRRWIRKGHVRALKFGRCKNAPVRIDAESLLQYLESLVIPVIETESKAGF